MDGQILQGSFVSTGANVYIPLRTGVTWMKVYDYTTANTSVADEAYAWYWQLGMPTNIRSYHHTGGSLAAFEAQGAAGDFVLYDSSIIDTTATVAFTDITNAAPGVVTSGATAAVGLQNGDIVRLYNIVGGQQLGGIDFTVSAVGANAFTLRDMAAIVAVPAPGATAVWRKIPYDAYFYPVHRYISKVRAWPTDLTKTQITMTVTHGYQIGQKVRFVVPAAYGMTGLNGLQATIIQINVTDNTASTNTIVVDLDCNAFAAFAFPVTAAVPFSPAMVVPIGMDTAEALYPAPMVPIILPQDILSDATKNIASIGMILRGGATPTFGPGGKNNDVMYWMAGTSFGM